MSRKLRILTWHVHGNYMYYLSQVPHDFYLVADAERSTHHSGRSGILPWGDNVHDAPIEQIKGMSFDVILFQSRQAYEQEQFQILSSEQRRLPRIYLEHDPPQQHPTDTLHWVQDRETLLVHVTPFNALMWDNGITPHRVVEHGVQLLTHAVYNGERAAGIVVVNNLDKRGRRLGADVYLRASSEVPLTLVGMGAERMGGHGEVSQAQLPEVMASHRFFFNPIRYTSLGLAVVEAMMVGVPVVGLATTELSTVIRSGVNGLIDTRVDALIEGMRHLLLHPEEARRLGERGRQTAQERFHIRRFVDDWLMVLRDVTS
ncbi:MAG: glycosyltransferase family 4 protein [Acidobacteriota bacterium]